MFTRYDLIRVLTEVEGIILRVDPSLAEALGSGPPQNPEEPFLFEYLDRLIAALTSKAAGKGPLASKPAILAEMIGGLQEIRTLAAEEWGMR